MVTDYKNLLTKAYEDADNEDWENVVMKCKKFLKKDPYNNINNIDILINKLPEEMISSIRFQDQYKNEVKDLLGIAEFNLSYEEVENENVDKDFNLVFKILIGILGSLMVSGLVLSLFL